MRLRWRVSAGAASPVFWSGLEAAISGLLSAVSAFAIARIVGPSELGIGAAVVAVHVLLWIGVNALFADALVQRAALADRSADSAFWASCVSGCLAALAQLAAGFGLVRALHDPRLFAMSAMLAAALPLVGAAGPVQGLLTRARAYRVLAGRAVIGQGLGTIVGIAAACAGAGAWAVVLQQVCVSAAGALSLLLGARWRPRWRCGWAEMRDLLRIGLPLTASTLVQHGRYRLFALLIGAMAGPALLGQVHLAFRLVDTVRDLMMTALWRLLLPAMADHQKDPASLLACLDRCLARAGWVMFPVCAAMALAMVPLVELLLGPVWAQAGQSAQLLVALMAYVLAGFPGGVAGIARGQPKYALFTNLAALAVTLAAAALLRPATPLHAIAVWAGAQALTSPYGLAMNARLLHVGLFRPLRAGLPSLAVSALAVFAGFVVPNLFANSPFANPFGDGPLGAIGLIAERLLAGGMIFLPFLWRAAGGAGLRRAAGLTGLAWLILANPAQAQLLANYFPEGVPGYDTARGVTVQSRARPLYDPPGIQAGGFLLHPVLEEGSGYDTNLLGSARSSGSWGIATRPSLLVASNWSRDSLAAYASLDDIRTLDLPSQGQTNATVLLGGALDIGRDRATLAVAHLALHQASTEIDALASDTPVAYQVDDVRAGYTANFNRLSITPDANFSRYRYDATIIQGTPSGQGYRDRGVARGGVTLRYELAPGRYLVVAGRGTDTVYAQPQPGAPTRNSTGYGLLAGLDYDYDGQWRARVLLGWERRDFAAVQYATHSAPIAEAGLIWTPTGLTTITATLSQSIEDAAQEGTAGFTYTSAKLRLDHEYLRDLLLHAGAGVQRAVFTQGGGTQGGSTQNGITLAAGATWLIDRNLRLSADYAFTSQQGTPNPSSNPQSASNGGYDRNIVLITLRFAL